MAEIPELLEFKSWIPNGDTYKKRLQNLVREGKLPPDVLFRAMHIGIYEPVPDSAERPFRSLYWETVTDAMDNADMPSSAQAWTQHLIFRPELPETVTDLGEHRGIGLYKHLTSPYWSKGALKKVIMQRRVAEGAALTDPRHELHWTWETEQYEKNRCDGLAQAVWRTLIRRLRPDIIEHAGWFYPDAHISMNGVHVLSERTIRRHAIAYTRIKDEAMRTLYDEIETTGMRGIGPVGKRDIAVMLAPEHPDIMQRLAEEEGIDIELLDY